jgi:hypothetical protein
MKGPPTVAKSLSGTGRSGKEETKQNRPQHSNTMK